jgi:large-conductance mechanosensitive channel
MSGIVLDYSVALIIVAAFSADVTSLVNDLARPPIGCFRAGSV